MTTIELILATIVLLGAIGSLIYSQLTSVRDAELLTGALGVLLSLAFFGTIIYFILKV